jgi:hypothetical protein
MGDVVIICITKGDDVAIGTNPTGFTEVLEVAQTTGDDMLLWFGYRVITNSEANTVDTLLSTDDEWSGGAILLRGCDPRRPIQTWSQLFSSNTSDPIAPTVTTVMDSGMAIFYAGHSDTSTAATITDPAGTTRNWVRKDVSGNFFNSSYCARQTYAAPTATGTKTFDLNTSVTTAETNQLSIVVRADHDAMYRTQRNLNIGARQFRLTPAECQVF